MKKTFLLLIIIFISCNSEKPRQFTDEAYKEMLVDLDNSKITLREVLYYNKGKKTLIDVWASWCKDCIVGIPKIKELQKKHQRFEGTPKYNYLLRSILKCEKCGRNFIGRYRESKNDNYYQCLSTRSRTTNCGNPFVNIPKIESFLINHLFKSRIL